MIILMKDNSCSESLVSSHMMLKILIKIFYSYHGLPFYIFSYFRDAQTPFIIAPFKTIQFPYLRIDKHLLYSRGIRLAVLLLILFQLPEYLFGINDE